MPRKRIRTTEKAQWTLETLNCAIKTINEDKVSIHKAAKDFGIPYSTLQKRCHTPVPTAPRLGRKAVFNKQQEELLADHLIRMSQLFYGIDSIKLRKIAYECAERLKISHRFNKETKSAGPDWVDGFLKRNPRISIRKPESTSINRIEGFNKKEVARFHKNLEELMTKNNFECHQIFNMDETGISTVQQPNKILAKLGQKRVGTIVSWERGKTITVICAMNAAGTFVPPLFIFPRQRHSPHLEKDGPPGAIYDCSKNGWTNEMLFIKWLRHFKNFVKPSQENKILLIIDNHNSHCTLNAYEFCKENHIAMLSIPPHSSHRMQPLDVTFFGPLKKAYNRECDLYLKSKSLVKITPYEVAGLFKNAYCKVASIDKGISGFRATGIYPMNPNMFSDDDFFVTDTTATNVAEVSSNNEENISASFHSSADDHLSETEETNDISANNTSIANSSSTTEVASILSIVSPEPSTSREIRRHSNKQHSEIITSSPYKTILENKKRKRLMKENKSPKKTKKSTVENKKKTGQKLNVKCTRYLFRDDSSSCNEFLNDNVENESDACKVCNEHGKFNELWYRCRSCGDWAHAECSGCDSAKEYVCDSCLQH